MGDRSKPPIAGINFLAGAMIGSAIDRAILTIGWSL